MQSWIANVRLRTKLFIILLLATLIIGVSNGLLIQKWNASVQQLEQEYYDELYSATFYLLNADRDYYQADQALRTIMGDLSTGASTEQTKKDFQDNSVQVLERIGIARSILSEDRGLEQAQVTALFEDFSEQFAVWQSQALQMMESTDTELNTAELNRQFEQTREIIDLIQQQLESSAVATVQSLNEDNQRAVTVFMLVIVVCVAVMFGLGAMLIRNITKPISKLVQDFRIVAQGDLQAVQRSEMKRNDEIGALTADFHVMVDNVRGMVGHIQEIAELVERRSRELNVSADQVRIGAEQVSATTEQLSSVSTEQAGASGEIAESIENINRQLHAVSGDGQALETASQQVYDVSKAGREQMDHTVHVMDELATVVSRSAEQVRGLSRRTEQISELMDVIHEISEQTNLLALNASIEAARAGEAGQGFAVVAGEIRKLADQVKRSSAEITTITRGIRQDTRVLADSLESGHAQAETGSTQMHASRASFEAIAHAVTDMLERISNVTRNLAAITEQSSRISGSVTQIASAAEQSAAGIEEASAIAEQQTSSMEEVAGNASLLAAQSEQLKELVKQFRL